jgi:hypothetical protein
MEYKDRLNDRSGAFSMSIRSLCLLCVSSAALLLAGTATAQVVVLSARGPSSASYPQGSVLPTNKVLVLKAGDRLELLDGSGSHVVTGPGNVVAGHMDRGSEARLMDIFLKSQQVRPGIAATRGFSLQSSDEQPSESNSGPGLWQVDTKAGGDTCIVRGETPALGRGVDGAPSPVRIIRQANGDSRGVTWVAGENAVSWPADLPVTEGEHYSITLDDGSRIAIVWRAVDRQGDGMTGLATALLDKGCFVQLDRLRAVVAGR